MVDISLIVISAVDAHVGNFILKECFVKYLGDKTRVLVTHKFESLKYVNYIYIFKKGRIVEEGTMEDLKNSETFHEIEEKYKMKTQEEGKEEGKIEDQEIAHEIKNEDEILDNNKIVKSELDSKLREEEDKELENKLMLNEDREKGDIGWKVWKSYFTYYGGTSYFLLVFIVMVIFITLQTASNFWLSYWSDVKEEDGHSKAYYFGIYSVFGLSYAFFCLIRIAMLLIQSIKCSRQIHKDMISRIIRAPINNFFDRVPTGRVLNRLSKDLNTLDTTIATSFGSFLVNLFSVIAEIVVCVVVGTVWILPLAMIFFIVSYKVQRKYMNLNREVTRLGR